MRLSQSCQTTRRREAELVAGPPGTDAPAVASAALGLAVDPAKVDRERGGGRGARRAARLHDVLICHASEDKEAIVQPLAGALTRRNVRVWFDEYELRIGDRLRRSIDRGLAQSRYGIVVLSPAFFAKEWPQLELDGLVSREAVAGEKIILPIWHNVSRDDILRYSPTVAGRLARSTSERSVDAIAAEIAGLVNPARRRLTDDVLKVTLTSGPVVSRVTGKTRGVHIGLSCHSTAPLENCRLKLVELQLMTRDGWVRPAWFVPGYLHWTMGPLDQTGTGVAAEATLITTAGNQAPLRGGAYVAGPTNKWYVLSHGTYRVALDVEASGFTARHVVADFELVGGPARLDWLHSGPGSATERRTHT